HANDSLDGRVQQNEKAVEIQPYSGLPALTFHHSGAAFEVAGGWYYNTEYLEELDRGLDFREDLYCPGVFTFEMTPGSPVRVVATIDPEPWEDGQAGRLSPLETAADQFRVRRADGKPTVIAGYPWFTDWGRDTMICIPGLLVARGLVEEAREVIRGFLEHLNKGLIPNRFPDHGERPEYNTADATLWMFQAVHACERAGADMSFFYPAGKEIVAWHERGTHHGIGVDPADGLLAAGEPGSQLTWMDAKVGDWVVTPRHGKPVEINALWYNALRLMEGWAKRAGDPAAPYARAARKVRASFAAAFWNPQRNCLYDVIAPSGPDPSLRPNQIFAVSLPFPLLDPARRKAVVKTVEQSLLTPVGLRSLAPGEPGYRPRYQGGPWERDGAYHQGTVWPWLLGPFITAYLRAFGRSKKNVVYCRSLALGLEQELYRGCLGTIGEIYDAEAPHRPVGAPAQAWSVAELLRVRYANLSE
ncbi:MAG: glycogen debranching enzyme N-terminal domain-containing protein, partial [Acidobacteria bacterium]|nr:glycogen debranching enzyme N-terminal domain-containing protein [Acidobacteriota bacterium]